MMSNLVVIDGSEGEGGGQVLRSALSLSMITGQAFRLERVRAKRKPSGLKAQHLTCVTGAAAIANARVEGASLGSNEIEFYPREVSTDPRSFDVGTAGATSLLLQCLFYPLAIAGGAHLALRGGTHVTFSPTFDYLERVWLPMVRHFGFEAELTLDVAGFFPQGGGSLRAAIEAVRPGDEALDFAPAEVRRAEVLSTVGGLPLEIASRQNAAACERLGRERLRAETEVLAPTTKHSKGSACLVWSSLDNGLVAGASWIGDRGVRAEDVGRNAAEHFIAFARAEASADEHLGDQLLLPAALAAAGFLGERRETSFVASVITDHLTTHASVIRQFLDVEVSIDERLVSVAPANR
jgi:RNA 3'-terminal phosphate cyclase (ATP)